MRSRKPNFLAFLMITLLVASCVPQVSTPSPQDTSTSAPEPTLSIPDATPVDTSVPLPTPQVDVTPAGDSIQAVPISIDNAASLAESRRAFQTNPQNLVWKLDGSTFAALNQRELVIFNAQTLTTSAAFSVTDPGMLLGFSADGKTAAVTADQVSLDLYDAVTNTQLLKIDVPEMVYGAAFSPDGRSIAVALFDQIGASLWEVSSGNFIKLLTGFETAAPIYSISFSGNGRSLVWHARAGVQLQDIDSGEMGMEFSHEDFVSGIAVSPDGRLLATGAAGTMNDAYTPLVTLWDTSSGQEVRRLPTASVPNSLAFSPDNRLLAGGVTNTLLIWDVETGAEVFSKDATAVSITSVTFSPDGSIIAVTTADNNIQLWQVAP